MESVRALEDLIIDTMYNGLVAGKIDQRQGIFRVKSAVGRDVPPDKVADVAHQLGLWQTRCSALIEALEASSRRVAEEREVRRRHDATGPRAPLSPGSLDITVLSPRPPPSAGRWAGCSSTPRSGWPTRCVPPSCACGWQGFVCVDLMFVCLYGPPFPTPPQQVKAKIKDDIASGEFRDAREDDDEDYGPRGGMDGGPGRAGRMETGSRKRKNPRGITGLGTMGGFGGGDMDIDG